MSVFVSVLASQGVARLLDPLHLPLWAMCVIGGLVSGAVCYLLLRWKERG